jgi:hypothetical protein
MVCDRVLLLRKGKEGRGAGRRGITQGNKEHNKRKKKRIKRNKTEERTMK